MAILLWRSSGWLPCARGKRAILGRAGGQGGAPLVDARAVEAGLVQPVVDHVVQLAGIVAKRGAVFRAHGQLLQRLAQVPGALGAREEHAHGLRGEASECHAGSINTVLFARCVAATHAAQGTPQQRKGVGTGTASRAGDRVRPGDAPPSHFPLGSLWPQRAGRSTWRAPTPPASELPPCTWPQGVKVARQSAQKAHAPSPETPSVVVLSSEGRAAGVVARVVVVERRYRVCLARASILIV